MAREEKPYRVYRGGRAKGKVPVKKSIRGLAWVVVRWAQAVRPRVIVLEKGRIVITDRKKDILVNDRGDNVSPQRIEGMLTLQPEIAQAMVYGDRRPHFVALLVPDPEIASEQDVQQRLQRAVDRVNSDLSVIEKVRRFIRADEGFSIENEQLTPSMKIRRHVIGQVYGERLDALYRR